MAYTRHGGVFDSARGVAYSGYGATGVACTQMDDALELHLIPDYDHHCPHAPLLTLRPLLDGAPPLTLGSGPGSTRWLGGEALAPRHASFRPTRVLLGGLPAPCVEVCAHEGAVWVQTRGSEGWAAVAPGGAARVHPGGAVRLAEGGQQFLVRAFGATHAQLLV